MIYLSWNSHTCAGLVRTLFSYKWNFFFVPATFATCWLSEWSTSDTQLDLNNLEACDIQVVWYLWMLHWAEKWLFPGNANIAHNGFRESVVENRSEVMLSDLCWNLYLLAWSGFRLIWRWVQSQALIPNTLCRRHKTAWTWYSPLQQTLSLSCWASSSLWPPCSSRPSRSGYLSVCCPGWRFSLQLWPVAGSWLGSVFSAWSRWTHQYRVPAEGNWVQTEELCVSVSVWALLAR